MNAPRWTAAAMMMALAGCAGTSPPPAAVSAPAAPSAPAMDQAAVRSMISQDQTLETLDIAAGGSRTVEGEIRGYKTTVYAVPMAAGQSLEVRMQARSGTPGFNVFDSSQPQAAAIHRGETAGRTARVTARSATTFLVSPYSPRAFARRGAIFPYTLTITRR